MMEIIERSGVGRVWAEDGMNRDGTEDFEAVKLSCILYKDRYVHMSKSVECTMLGCTRARHEDVHL